MCPNQTPHPTAELGSVFTVQALLAVAAENCEPSQVE
jgi:hypothetical protein